MQTSYKIKAEMHAAESTVTLWLNGNFGQDALAELEQSIAQARGDHRQVYIDLSEVTLVDRTAVQYFSQQAGGGVMLVNCPVYLRCWIKGVAQDAEN